MWNINIMSQRYCILITAMIVAAPGGKLAQTNCLPELNINNLIGIGDVIAKPDREIWWCATEVLARCILLLTIVRSKSNPLNTVVKIGHTWVINSVGKIIRFICRYNYYMTVSGNLVPKSTVLPPLAWKYAKTYIDLTLNSDTIQISDWMNNQVVIDTPALSVCKGSVSV